MNTIVREEAHNYTLELEVTANSYDPKTDSYTFDIFQIEDGIESVYTKIVLVDSLHRIDLDLKEIEAILLKDIVNEKIASCGVHYKLYWHHKPSGDVASANRNFYMNFPKANEEQDAMDTLIKNALAEAEEYYPHETYDVKIIYKAISFDGKSLNPNDYEIYTFGDQEKIEEYIKKEWD